MRGAKRRIATGNGRRAGAPLLRSLASAGVYFVGAGIWLFIDPVTLIDESGPWLDRGSFARAL